MFKATMIFILKIIAMFLNIILALVVGYFLSPLRWANEDDRPSIIGFWSMLVAYVLNIFLLTVG